MEETVGFVGLGVMGRPMAVNLAKTHAVIGFDLRSQRFEGATGLTRAADLAEVAARANVVCLSLPSADAVKAVVLGVGGLAELLRPGTAVVDFSTSLPSVSRAVAARLAERSVAFADAPVSGGEGGAKAASLAIMVGASEATFERVRPILASVGGAVVRVGEVGAGGVAKLVNNMIVGSAFAVIAEGFALASANGVDTGLLYDAIRTGWAGSKVLDVTSQAVAADDFRPGGTIDMMEKDLAYARLLALESRVPIPLTAIAHEVFVAGQAAGHGGLSQPAIYGLWNRLRQAPGPL